MSKRRSNISTGAIYVGIGIMGVVLAVTFFASGVSTSDLRATSGSREPWIPTATEAAQICHDQCEIDYEGCLQDADPENIQDEIDCDSDLELCDDFCPTPTPSP